ncbi:DUF4031 domain-containing protein [Alicyclobacillus sp. SO9]|uniref:DUF4031 domain-containing protein n=1 Tax=Alicyclobacillus sp. SO9 TaxID=2665646 RepID=UPI0018E6F5A3|nr:DUF4031 domain-containing protein [Alicyclobacillus sp. SO9]
MLYTDGIHLISDTSVDELTRFGEELGLKREWIHWTPGRPHFDLINEEIRSKAIRAGAKRTHRREFVAALRRMPSYHDWIADKNKNHSAKDIGSE